jgi:hypothetical protein
MFYDSIILKHFKRQKKLKFFNKIRTDASHRQLSCVTKKVEISFTYFLAFVAFQDGIQPIKNEGVELHITNIDWK